MALARIIRSLQELCVNKSEAVVALSGGSDSVALLYAAKQLFKNVRAITVDHKVREESYEEALKTGSIANSLGVDHVIVPVERKKKTGFHQQILRELRYKALLNFCKEVDCKTLLLGHHVDDQLETFINRLGNESGLVGLRCMKPISYRIGHLDVKIVRPLLECTKEELRGICENAGLPWLEDSSNEMDKFYRNRIRKELDSQEWLKPNVLQLLRSVQDIGRDVDEQVLHVLEDVVSIEESFGYGVINFQKFRKLSPPIGKRILSLLSDHIAGTRSGNMKNLTYVYNKLVAKETLPKTAVSLSFCVIHPDHKTNRVMVVRQLPRKNYRSLMPLHVHQSVVWDNRFRIAVSKAAQGEQASFKSLFVRHMVPTDHQLAKKGFKRNKRSKKVPPLASRGGLPIIVDDKGSVVSAPHLGYLDLNYGIHCKVTFDPAIPLLHNLDVDL